MARRVSFVLLFLITSSSALSLTKFSIHSSPTPPHPGGWWFVHYDTNNKNIWMLNPLSYNGSSWRSHQYLQSYDISSATWRQYTYNKESAFETWSQSYASIGSTLFFVSEQSTFGTFNVETQELLHPHPTIALSRADIVAPCMTTDGRHLFFIGGRDTAQSVASFQIYDTLNNEWMDSGTPSLNIARTAHTCQYHDGYVYAFGGTSNISAPDLTNSIEMIYVGYGDDVLINARILSQNWTLLSSKLAHECLYPTSTRCADANPDLIYIFGGADAVETASAPWRIYDFVQVFNTTNKVIYNTSITLNTRRAGASTFCMAGYIYLMLGVAADGSMLYNWERSNALVDINENGIDRVTGILIALSMILGTIVIICAMWFCSKCITFFKERAKVKRVRDIDLVEVGSQSELVEKKNKKKGAPQTTDQVAQNQKETDRVEEEEKNEAKKRTIAFTKRVESVEYGAADKDDANSVQDQDDEGDEGDEGDEHSDAESSSAETAETDSEDLYDNANNDENNVTVR